MLTNIGTQTIETQRLILRKFEITDAEQMFNNWANDIDVCKYLSWEPHKDIGETKQVIQNWVDSYSNDWAIVYKTSGETIGSISIYSLDEINESCEIGYCMSKNLWGMGLMTEALNTVIQYMFNNSSINRITAKHDVRNPASGKVMVKCGMKFEGNLRQLTKRKDGEYCDHAIYSILRSDIM